MKKPVKITLITVASVLAALCLCVALLWGNVIKTIASVHQVGDNEYLYEMDYNVEYDLDEIIASDLDTNQKLLQYVVSKLSKGIIPMKANADEMVGDGFACTSFQVTNPEGGYFYGRNYDFFKNPTLVTHSRPKNGYASVACSDMSHFGYNLTKLPKGFIGKAMCIAGVYAPVDGINEKGLCTSIMALPKQHAHQNSGNHKVGTTIIMRLWLDRCATVEEALALLETLDVCHDPGATGEGSGYHYMVADAKGDVAVVEFDREDGWKTMIVRKPQDEASMLVTNHLLSPKYYTTEPNEYTGNPHSHSWWRYETCGGYINEHAGVLNLEQAQEALSLVHWKDLTWDNGVVEDTQFSNVYDQKNIALYLREWNDYDRTVKFVL